MDKRFAAILVGLAIIIGGIFFFTQKSGDKEGGSSHGAQPTNHLTGNTKSKVKLVEYGDLQCPACFHYEPVVERIRNTFGKQISFQFRNLPLIQLHPNAFSAARAAEAADYQHKYWEMHDLLYKPANYQAWTVASDPKGLFENYAKQLSLNLDQFKTDYASSQVNDRINADLAEFKKTGKDQATPTFFLNGAYVDSANFPNPQVDPNGTFIKFSALLKAEIQKQAKK